MKTGNNNSTNNFIIRIWSPTYYNNDVKKDIKILDGTITNVKTKESVHVHSTAQMIMALELANAKAERERQKELKQARKK